jgi:hypothetical protein
MPVGSDKTTQDLITSAGLIYSDEEKNFINSVASLHGGEHWGVTTSTLYSTKLLDRALAKHSDALIAAAEASDRYAKNLVKATWALVIATAVLAIATIVLLFR